MIQFLDRYRTELGLTMAGKIIVSLFILCLTIFIIVALSWIAERLLKKRLANRSAKFQTLLSVLKNIIRVVILFIGITYVLDTFGVNTTSLIATAGIGGIAIGFGAQSIVKDVISGALLLVEDQFSLGDYIIVGSLEGYVIETGLRVTKLRSFAGEIHYIPNGNITAVTNISRGPMRASVKIKIPDTLPLDDSLAAIEKAIDAYAASVDFFVEQPVLLGITETMEFNQIANVVGHTKPMKQWEAEREMRYHAYRALEHIKETKNDRQTAL